MIKQFYFTADDTKSLSAPLKGTQPKWIKDGYIVKADMLGYEGIAEVMTAKLLSFTENVDYAEYEPCKIHVDDKVLNGCCTPLFLKEDEECISFYNILVSFFGCGRVTDFELRRRVGRERCLFVIDIVSKVTGVDVSGYVSTNLKLDALTLNKDRHLNNLCVIRGNKYWRECPIFDNGAGLLSDIESYDFCTPIRVLRRKVKAMPFCKDHLKQALYIDDKLLKIDFEGFKTKMKSHAIAPTEKERNRAYSVLYGSMMLLEGRIWEQI